MIQRLKPWYPFLFALIPILNVLTRNPGGSRLYDVAIVMGSALLLTAAVYLVVAQLFRGPAHRALVAPVVLAIVLLCYGKTALGSLSRQVAGAPPGLVLVILIAVLVLGIWWLARRPGALDRANTFFSLTGLLMFGWLGFRFVADLVHARSVVRHSALAQELARPIRSQTPAISSSGQRDVYLIVLDEYANAGVLRDQFQFDNRMFEDSLRHLGFTIPRSVHSNYVHTLLSLPSLLNFSHLTRLSAEVGARSTDATLPNYLLENNRTAAFFRRQGYRFLFFPSQWWPSTSRNRTADWQFDPWPGFNPGRAATRSDLRRSLLATTALAFLKRDDHWDADYIRRELSGLEQVPGRAEPTFTFAHIVSPHWPYVFTADCGVARQSSPSGRVGRKRAYTEQLRCLNGMVLHTVAAILQHSTVPPIILLQGDHGTNLLRYSDAKSAALVAPAQARERFGAFGAYYLPGDGSSLFADSVTIVNVLQRVLSHYFGAEVDPSPDELYLSLERTPYDFAKIDPTSFRALDSPARAGQSSVH
jgi:hypothetical protein